MKEKRNLIRRVKDWWDNLSPEDRAWFKGGFVGSISAAIGASITGKYLANKTYDGMIAKFNDQLDYETKHAYIKGMSDGQIKAYHDLLISPEKGFGKLGMKTEKF